MLRPRALYLAAILLVTSLAQAEVSLSFKDFGIKDPITLSGLDASDTVFLPVNPGLVPAELELKLKTTPELPPGYISVKSGGRVLAELPLTPETSEIKVPLKGAKVTDGVMELTFRVVFQGTDYCQSALLYQVRLLPESRVKFAGEPLAPTEIARFFPPYLKKVVFYLPDPPPDDAANAVLWAAAYLGERYRNLELSFRVKPLTDLETILNDPQTAYPFIRVIVWDNKEGARLIPRGEKLAPVLAIGDPVEAKKLFIHPLGMKTAVFPAENTVTARIELPEQVGRTVTLAELGLPAKRVVGMGQLYTDYTFAIADLGPGVYPSGINLRVVHSPATEGEAYLELALNGTAFKTVELKGSVTEFWAGFPRELLQRANRLELRYFYSPPSGVCSLGELPFSATVDPLSSYLNAKQGQPLYGFDALPQALLPKFGVFLENGSLPELQLAARLVHALQKTTKTKLFPEIVHTLDTRPLLAVGSAELARRLRAPIRAPGFVIYDVSGRTWLKVEVDRPYAALQAYESKGGMVLLLSTTAADPALAEELLSKLFTPDGWYGVHGDTAVLAQGSEPVAFSLNKSALRVKGLGQTTMNWLEKNRWLILALVLILLLLLLLWLYPRVVRPAEKKEKKEEEKSQGQE